MAAMPADLCDRIGSNGFDRMTGMAQARQGAAGNSRARRDQPS